MFKIQQFAALFASFFLLACSTSSTTNGSQSPLYDGIQSVDAYPPSDAQKADGSTSMDSQQAVPVDTSSSTDTLQAVDAGSTVLTDTLSSTDSQTSDGATKDTQTKDGILADTTELDATNDGGNSLPDGAGAADSDGGSQDATDASAETSVGDANCQPDVADIASSGDTVDAGGQSDASDATSQSDSGTLDPSPNCQLQLEARVRDQSGPCDVCKAGNYITLDAVVRNPCSKSLVYASAYSCIASEFSVLNLKFNSKAVYASSCSKNNPLNKTIAPGAFIKQSRPAGKLSANAYKLAVQFKNAGNTVRTKPFEVK